MSETTEFFGKNRTTLVIVLVIGALSILSVFILDWQFVLFRAFLPILGPVLFQWIVFTLKWTVDDETSRGALVKYIPYRRTFTPTGWVYFSIASCLASLFSLYSNSVPDAWVAGIMAVAGLIGSLIYLAVLAEEKKTTSVPRRSNALIYTTFMLAAGSAAASYLVYTIVEVT